MLGKFVGIDLGTTNSAVALAEEDAYGHLRVNALQISQVDNIVSNVESIKKYDTIPSVVYYKDTKGTFKPIVGKFAKEMYVSRPDFVAKSVKSQMGNPEVKGLSPNIPDKTPEKISERVLSAILYSAKKDRRFDYNTVNKLTVTVPANFAQNQRFATYKAMDYANIKNIKNNDGSWNENIMISEPTAVIYNLINDAKSIPDIAEKLKLTPDKPSHILVYDIGGGTLDVTYNIVTASKTSEYSYTISEKATNDYQIFGGDNFDKAIAQAMYKRFLAEYKNAPEILKNRDSIISRLIVDAENLKIEINNKVKNQDNDMWSLEIDDIENELFPVVNNNISTYLYSDNFTKKEFEDILEPLMGQEYSISDYCNAENIPVSQHANIIYPILSVLQKTSKELNIDTLPPIDCVVLNGGMSQLYLIINRLTEFFGMEPLSVTDPDLSVAKGAAIYSYYSSIAEQNIQHTNINTSSSIVSNINGEITIDNYFPMNQTLYLKGQSDTKCLIVSRGDYLPHNSSEFKAIIPAKNHAIALPVHEELPNKDINVIAETVLSCRVMQEDTYALINLTVNKNKVLSFKAKRYLDEKCTDFLEDLSCSLNFIDNNSTVKYNRNSKIVAIGQKISPLTVLSDLKNTYTINGISNSKNKNIKSIILNAPNLDDFPEYIIKNMSENKLNNNKDIAYQIDLTIIARKIYNSCSSSEKKAILKLLRYRLKLALRGFSKKGFIKNLNLQTIISIGIYGDKSDEEIILKFVAEYTDPCMFACARLQIGLDWLYDKFKKEYLKREPKLSTLIWAIGTALRRTDNCTDNKYAEMVLRHLLKLLDNELIFCKYTDDTPIEQTLLNNSVTAIGLIGDQRTSNTKINNISLIDKAKTKIVAISRYMKSYKCVDLALKLLNNIQLNEDDESLLLKFITNED